MLWFILLHFPCCISQYVISNIFLFLFDRIIRLHFFNALSINTIFCYGCSRYLLTFFIQNCLNFFLIVRYRVRSVQEAYCKLFQLVIPSCFTDPCSSLDCLNNGLCKVNLNGTAYCDCVLGFKGMTCDIGTIQ